jgi:succinate dehydrogenase/fumarate reductase flavoprotein subunit
VGPATALAESARFELHALQERSKTVSAEVSWTKTVDVVVVGYGFAGANAAISAHDTGAQVLLIEKMPSPGGISICSAGGLRVASDEEAAFQYLQRTNGGTAPEESLRALAKGMTEVTDQLAGLAEICNAQLAYKEAPGIYPFGGRETFGFAMVDSIPDFDPAAAFPQTKALGAGALVFKVLQDNIEQRDIEVWLGAPAERLLTDANDRVVGIRVERAGEIQDIRATRGVVLACGGFEADEDMQRQFWQAQPVLSCAFLGNTGDGIRMAQAVGADLWHMWHFHGTYGFRAEGYPLGIRTKRLPDWFPGVKGEFHFDGFFNDGRAVQMPWILLNRDGQRFMNEYEPYMQDTGHRPFERYRPETQDFPAIPCWLIADEQGRQLYPWGQPMYNDLGLSMAWSKDNLAEVDAGIIGQAASLEELAEAIGVELDQLVTTIDQWNVACEAQSDDEWGRPPSSMRPIVEAPFYYATMWPVVSNTQGGPVHDVRQRVLNPFKEPIPGLYSAGELGSVFGHLYLSGGNVTECFVGGNIAGREAALSNAG